MPSARIADGKWFDMNERIYVCHTFYHVYVTCLKELAIRREAAYAAGEADRVRLKERAEGVAAVNGDTIYRIDTFEKTTTHDRETENEKTSINKRNNNTEECNEIPNIDKRNYNTVIDNKNSSIYKRNYDTPGTATLILSKMSTEFGSLVDRARASGLFAEVIEFDEKRDDYFEELAPLRKNTGSIVSNMFNRIRFCKRFPELEAPYVPVDFRQYRDIYVFCDSDPVGYYLNANGISYHAVEDGLNCLKRFDAARFDNRGAFPVKRWMAKKGFIFIQNGYAKHCLDMEVNDLSVLSADADGVKIAYEAAEDGTAKRARAIASGKKPVYVELPRRVLTGALTKTDKLVLTRMFIENADALQAALMQQAERPRILILTEKILDTDARGNLFTELVARYATWKGRQALVFVKPHPRDEVDYRAMFSPENDGVYSADSAQVTGSSTSSGAARPEVIVLSSAFPMEMLNFIEGLCFDAVVSVFTQTDAVLFAKERISLADEFAYAAPELSDISRAVPEGGD